MIWGGEGQGAATLKRFFEYLGPERATTIQFVSMNMDAGYTKSVRENLPQAEIVYDPFHVTQLVNKALDEVRREEMRCASTHEEAMAFVRDPVTSPDPREVAFANL